MAWISKFLTFFDWFLIGFCVFMLSEYAHIQNGLHFEFALVSIYQIFILILLNKSIVLNQELFPKIKYQNSHLPDKVATSLIKDLSIALNAKSIYVNPSFTLKDAASLIQISSVELSQILNVNLNTSFYQFLAEFRVTHAKRLIDEGILKTMTIEELAKQSGFSSKTTLYKFFKSKLNMSPREYSQMIKN
jgi:AraC-like DNA-binding protein